MQQCKSYDCFLNPPFLLLVSWRQINFGTAGPLELSFLVKLPEEVKFNDIPKINDAKSIWRLGMRKIEETFAEHIANMHIDFEDKVVTYANI